MDLLIVFNDGTHKIIPNVQRGKHNRDIDMYLIEKGGLTSFIPRENVRYFGPKEMWTEDE